MPNVVILTGSGISAESGLKTFRDAGGLWEGHRVEEVATPEAFRRNPILVYEFYNQRRRQLQSPEVQPNPAHRAVEEFEKKWRGDFLLVTQNVDDLHERSGSKKVVHMHGELLKARCSRSGKTFHWPGDLTTASECACCKASGSLRPDIVWFGEMPMHMDSIYKALDLADIFISIGTSGLVYPAAGFVQATRTQCRKIECNLADTATSNHFTEHYQGPASVVVAQMLNDILA